MANNGQGFPSMSEEERKAAASKGGKVSQGKFGSAESADPSEAGRMGAKAQSTADKAKGGRH